MLGLKELTEEFSRDEFKPSALEQLYSYFLEHGVTLEDIDGLPIPYIINCYLTAVYNSQQAAKKDR